MLDENERKVYIYLQEKPDSKNLDIANNTGMKSRTIRAVISRLIDKGLVVKNGAGKNTTYSLVEYDDHCFLGTLACNATTSEAI